AGTRDGRFVTRSFDGSNVGDATVVDLHGLTNFPVAQLTGAFFDAARERLYYTVRGRPHLFWRWFTPEGRVVGAEVFRASTSVDWSGVRGMTLVEGTIY